MRRVTRGSATPLLHSIRVVLPGSRAREAEPARDGGATSPLLVVHVAREPVALRVAALAEAAGFAARVLPEGGAALPPDAALVIVDLAGADAAATVAALRAEGRAREVPLLVIARDDDEEALRRAILAGADDFVREVQLGRDLPLRLAVQKRAWEAREELRRRERDLRSLVDLTRSFAGALDTGALLPEVTRRLAEELDLRRCSIVLIDDRGERGTVVAASDDAAPTAKGAAKKRIDLFKYPEILEALRTRRPVVVEDADRHPLLDPVKEAISAAGLGALAVLPMVLEDRVLGVLFLRAAARSFAPREIGFAAAAANATAVALRNARSVEEIRGRIEEAEKKVGELRQFEDVFEHVSEGMALVSARDGSTLVINPSGLQILGLTAGEVRGKKARDIVRPVDEAGYRAIVDRVAAGEIVRSLDLRVLRPDGRTIELSVGAARLESQGLVVLFFRDVTERRRFQGELQRTKEFLEKLIESSVDGIVAADLKGRIILFNKGAEALLGYAAPEAVGSLHVTGLYPDGGAHEVMRMLRSEQFGGAGRLTAHRREILHKDGTRIPVQMSAAVIKEGDEEIASVGIFTDLRERLRTEEKLVFAEQRLEKSERAAMIAELAGTAAHELNQPLTSVMGYAELLKRRLKEDDPLYRAVDIIFREAERMAEIVRKIGKITRYETKAYVGKARIVDLERSTGEEEPK